MTEADNSLLLQQLKMLLGRSSAEFLFMHGAAASGKSHLLQAAVRHAGDGEQLARYLPLAELRDLPPEALLEGVEQLRLLCLDDVEQVLGLEKWEQALFSLYNKCLAAGVSLVVSASLPPNQLSVDLADLRSRLQAFACYKIAPLSDESLAEAVEIRAKAIGLVLSRELAEYIVLRCHRDMHSLMAAVATLDTHSLASQRRLTKPFVKSVMTW